MQDDRNSARYRQWRRDVLQRDERICRVCEEHGNSHVHHIKPLEKYPDLATEVDNGITLCGNCHTRLKGKEESTNLQTIIEAVTRKPDTRTADQLKRLNVKFCDYLEPLLKSDDLEKRNNAVFQLLGHLYVYPDSLNQFLPLIKRFLLFPLTNYFAERMLYNRRKGFDEEIAGQIVIEFLKHNSSEASSQVVDEYKKEFAFTVYFERGLTNYLDEGDWDNAIINFTKATELYPNFAEAYSWRGVIYKKKCNYEKAIADFTSAIELKPNDAHFYCQRGEVHLEKDNFESVAIADFTSAIKLKPDYAEAYSWRGRAHMRTYSYDRAIADFTSAIKLKPNDVFAYFGRGKAYLEIDDNDSGYDNAIADFTSAIKLKPDYADVYLERGEVYWRRKDYNRVIADCTHALQIIKTNTAESHLLGKAYLLRGEAYSDKGDYDPAIADITQVIQLEPNNANNYLIRGTIYKAKGDYARAQKDFEKADQL